MDIKLSLAAGLIALLLFACRKKDLGYPKEGYEYTNTSSYCEYIPAKDSISLNDSIILIAFIPNTFHDETSNVIVHNSADIVQGPLHITMLYPVEIAAADSFKLTAQKGKVIKDTLNFSEGILRGFRTMRWDKNSNDSFQIKISIKPLAKGVYIIALGQQSSRDRDGALYKFFLSVKSDQHLYYLSQYNNGYIGDYERNFGYCFKVY